MRSLPISLRIRQIGFWIFILVIPALADTTSPPCSYKVASGNGEFIFVMLVPPDSKSVECLGQTEEKKRDASVIRSSFPKSGMYRAKSTKPEWTVAWFSHEVLVPSTGNTVVRLGPWASNGNDEAFSIIEKGELVKTYRVKDLVSSIDKLPRSASHFVWKKDISLNDLEQTLTLSTLAGDEYVYHFRTGELSKENQPVNESPNGGPSLCVSLLFVLWLTLLVQR